MGNMRWFVAGVAGALGLGLLVAPPAAARTGDCLTLTAAQRGSIAMPAATPVECDQPHTAEVLGRVKMPSGITTRSTRVQRAWSFRACQKTAVKRLVGATATVLPPASYALPRTAQLSAYLRRGGADCVGFNTSAKGSVVSRTGSVAGSGLTPHVCLNDRSWRMTRCSDARAIPLTNVVWLSDGLAAGYPGTKRALSQTRADCEWLGAPQELEPNAWYSFGPGAWEQGNRYGYCQMAPAEWDSGWHYVDIL